MEKVFSIRLKKLRNEKGKSQVKLAKELGIRPATYQYYEDGGEANYENLGKIAKYFNVTTDYLIGLKDEYL